MSKTSNPKALEELCSWVWDVAENRELHLEFRHYLQTLPYGTVTFEDLTDLFYEVLDAAPDVALQLLHYSAGQEQFLWELQHSKH